MVRKQFFSPWEGVKASNSEKKFFGNIKKPF